MAQKVDRSAAPSDVLVSLEARLGDGYDRIEAARLAGQDVTAWEEFWLDLLAQYEAAYDALSDQQAA
jgi:translation initiation factor 2 alpha subunit (eIF-2alpha)